MKVRKCQLCDFKSHKLTLLRKHVQNDHDGLAHACTECDYKSRFKFQIEKHTITKHSNGNVIYPCSECTLEASTQEKLRNHMRGFHNIGKYSCELCEFEDERKYEFRNHMELKHNVDLYFYCDECSIRKSTKLGLKYHKIAVHEGVRYPCEKCELSFSSRDSLKNHIRTKHEGRGIKCEQCHHKSRSLAQLKEHVEAVHQGIKYQCDHCGLNTRRARDLKRHRRNKHGLQEANIDVKRSLVYPCSYCDYKNDSYLQLASHMQKNHPNIKTEQTEK